MLNVLLFGSTGLLGTHLLREFLRRQWEVCAPRRNDISLFNLTQVSNFAGSWLHNYPGGLIVYAAGYTDVTACDKNPGNAQHLNVLAPYLLANLCGRVGARFIYFSTDQVFMNRTMGGRYLHHEDDGLTGYFRTEQVYGASKAKAEQIIRLEPNHLIIRTSWLFGEHPTRSNFIKDITTRSNRGEPVIGLHDYIACPSYAPDVAAAMAQLLSDPDAHGTYHLVNGPPISRFEMAKSILYLAGLESEVQLANQESMGPDWIQRNPNGGLNNNRGPRMRPWTDGLHEYLKTLSLPATTPTT